MSNPSYSLSNSPFLNQVRRTIQLKHMSRSTEKSYLYYIVDYIRFHNKQHPQDLGVEEIRSYLSYLATNRNVAASTQNIALSSLLFLYRQVLQVNLPYIDNIERARRPKRLPVVLTRQEIKDIFSQIKGVEHLVVSLLYRSGMRLMEGLRLRVKDIDFAQKSIIIRDGKGKQDRITMLPEKSIEPLRLQFIHAQSLYLRLWV